MNTPTPFGINVRDRRIALDWSVEKLARLTSRSAGAIENIESGVTQRPGDPMKEAIAKALQTTVAALEEAPEPAELEEGSET